MSHGIGLVAAVAAFPVLVMVAYQRGDMTGTVAATVFATTMVLLYLSSTLFHALPEGGAKRVFQVLELRDLPPHRRHVHPGPWCRHGGSSGWWQAALPIRQARCSS